MIDPETASEIFGVVMALLVIVGGVSWMYVIETLISYL